MTDETKKLFDAPWKLDENENIRNASGELVAEGGVSVDDLRRVTHLPELYDALVVTIYGFCNNCYGEIKTPDVPRKESFIENGCPFEYECCYAEIWKLLRKVREGE